MSHFRDSWHIGIPLPVPRLLMVVCTSIHFEFFALCYGLELDGCACCWGARAVSVPLAGACGRCMLRARPAGFATRRRLVGCWLGGLRSNPGARRLASSPNVMSVVLALGPAWHLALGLQAVLCGAHLLPVVLICHLAIWACGKPQLGTRHSAFWRGCKGLIGCQMSSPTMFVVSACGLAQRGDSHSGFRHARTHDLVHQCKHRRNSRNG